MKPLLSSPHRSPRCGFTLIELLIVITVIGILAGLLFPVFVRVRENGRRVTCTSNLRQLGLAMQLYTDDNNRHLPVGRPSPRSDDAEGRGWAGSLYSYARSAALLRCPDDSGLDDVRGTSSYAYNRSMVVRADGQVHALSLMRLIDIRKTVLLFEFAGDSVFDAADGNENQSPTGCGLNICVSGGKYATGYLGGEPRGDESFVAPLGRHDEKSIYLFVDGHVKPLRGPQVSPGLKAAASGDNQTIDKPPYTAAGTAFKGFEATFSPI